MRIGLQIPHFKWSGSPQNLGTKLMDIARTADDVGFASIWVMDHFFQIDVVGPPEDPMLEGYTVLGLMAGATQRVQLGSMVTGVIYRHPGILVKTVTTLDVLSGGRAYLGIGAGWFEREARGLGVPYPSTKERFEQLEETLQITKQMWSDTVAPYQGKHFQLAETLNQPQPLSKPHPPILIGGLGEQKTLRMVAQYGDACNLFVRIGEDMLRHKIDVLKRHCDELERPFEDIEITTLDMVRLGSGGITPAEFVEQCRLLATFGVQHAIVSFPNVDDLTPLEVFGREVIPAVAEL
ncbi:MAG: LLM class F420-dependent oxidoreductase [Chloroflexi bacterium AL-W]|nr:LLM class F420-dependent oxidoreductase [Chloroflexi bacterium AL-N1]NOK70640.1 LLM class F420-dependent oxidoreductase [Chloroflexi bacterium AL-N10]NOK78459.1 LLM class F420-dependent oxidoreductase [Chloroflexi bacterium AL-N5]NOK85543.1 LLM class F420-dependent oxidoreductase [Chloroflexi bacterium AL-W]NOK92457.1 LLM class F420-dependent oxidoreductase [Chloroflexi bacterium AL-N15]